MVRPIGKQGERKNVYLSKETIETIEEMSKIEGLNFSQYIDMSIAQMRESENPQILLDKVQQSIIMKEKEIQELKAKEIEIRQLINGISKWKNNIQNKRKDAIKIITNKILRNEQIEAERISRVWARMLHTNYNDLLAEAISLIEKGI